MSNPGDGDKRSVTTDALETLGKIIGPNEKRDAIHLAVEPVTAGTFLNPGQHIAVKDGVAYPTGVGKGLGIVDPFLAGPVETGQRFWFVMYPRMVHSLRHVWTHPSFTDEPEQVLLPASQNIVDGRKEASERWLQDFCATSDCPGYHSVMGWIENKGDWSDDEYMHFDGMDAHGEIPLEFWHHVEVVLGRPIKNRPTYFSCSC